MYDLTASELANKSALLIVRERYSVQLSPFVKNSKARLVYAKDDLAKIISEVCESTGADEEWVTSRFNDYVSAILEPVLTNPGDAKREELTNPDKDEPYAKNLNPNSQEGREGIVDADVLDRGEVAGAGREEALAPDATVDLSTETAPEGGSTEVEHNPVTSVLKEVMTSRDYRLIAGILAQTGASPEQINAFADSLESTNPLFDRERFIAAAGGSPMSGRDAPDYRPYSSCFRCQGDLGKLAGHSPVCSKCTHELLKKAYPSNIPGTDNSTGWGAAAPEPGLQEDPAGNPNLPYVCTLCGREGSTDEIRAHIERDHADVLQRQQEQSTQNMGQDNLGVQQQYSKWKMAEYKQDYKAGDRVTTPWGLGTIISDSEGMWDVRFDTPSEYGATDRLSADELQLAENKTADVPRDENAAEVQPLPENPGDRFDDYVQRLAETAAARHFSQLSDEDIHSIASQIGASPDEVRNGIVCAAVFGDQVAVNGQLGGDPSPPEGYEEISAQGLSGQQPTHDAVVPTDLVVGSVANDMNMSKDLAYNMVKDKYGADLPEQYHASISGQVHYYLPSGIAGNQQQQQQQQTGPAAPPAPQVQQQQQPAPTT